MKRFPGEELYPAYPPPTSARALSYALSIRMPLDPVAWSGSITWTYRSSLDRFNSASRSKKLLPSVIQGSAGSPFR